MVKRLFFFSYNFFLLESSKVGSVSTRLSSFAFVTAAAATKKNQIQWNSNEIYPKKKYMYMCVCVYININWNKLRKKQKQQVGSFIRTDGWPQSDSGTRHVASSSVRPGHRPPWPALARLGPPWPAIARLSPSDRPCPRPAALHRPSPAWHRPQSSVHFSYYYHHHHHFIHVSHSPVNFSFLWNEKQKNIMGWIVHLTFFPHRTPSTPPSASRVSGW